MGMFSGVETAKASLGGNYLRSGSYKVRIDQVKQGESRKNGGFVAIEMTILEVNESLTDRPHIVGEQATLMYMTKYDSFLSNWKAFVMGVGGVDESEVTEEESARIIGPEQPFSGLTVHVQVLLPEPGKKYCKPIWDTAEEFKAE